MGLDISWPVSPKSSPSKDNRRPFLDFNPERLILAGSALRLARVCVEDAYTYAQTRTTFGVPLISHALIRSKFSKFGQLIEPCFSFMEQLAYTIEVSKATGRD